MGVPLTFSSRTKTARPLALWPVTTVRTFSPCFLSSGSFMGTFLDRCNLVFIFNFPFVRILPSGGRIRPRMPAWQRVSDRSRLTGPFVERVGELVGHSRSHPDPLDRRAERKDDLAAAGRDSVSELALVVWGEGAMGESAGLTQRCALSSRLRFHRLDRLGRLCLLHGLFEPPVPLVFISLHHGLHSADPRRGCSTCGFSHARCAYAAADSVSGIRAR